MSWPNQKIKAAYDECRRIAQSHYENFPVGSFLVPKALRPHVYALYAFMRTADDFADLPGRNPDERLHLLAEWREHLSQASSYDPPSSPIFLALQHTIQSFTLSRKPFDLLLDAFEFDAHGEVRFETYQELHFYTQRSAEPVGQLVLALFGYRDEERVRYSNDICTALQLINFMQDAKADLSETRCYFPQEDMNLFGLKSCEDILNSPSAPRLVLQQCHRIESLLVSGSRLPEMVTGRLRYELRAILAGAWIMLGKIRAIGGDTIHQRPMLSPRERRLVLFKALG
ncbi:MAG: squalene synthase HpnC [Bacteroidota bacterium]|nr:squalene synthase HpnC [Bacteroidota bacterium]MDP4232681.1 squalene synthase HpnC [Bacteroidota bacterium]MDP4243186.1 squalene synthase HpnC [Bacteroidota bacterium]MDP4287643.1 squalene synthase HpnC [Bacteroidota bacterium]